MTEEKEILFENRFIRDEKSLKELYYASNRVKAFTILCGSVLAFILVFIVLFRIVFGVFDKTLLIYFGLIVAMYVLYLVFFAWTVRLQIRQQKELFGGKPMELTVEIRDDVIRMSSANGKNEIDWQNIKKVIQTKNLILLRTRARVIFDISKSGFIKGSYTEFCEFLRKKGYKVK